jgi:MFS family permease
MAFAAGGLLAWFADFVAATKGMSIEQATLAFGVIALTAGLAGVVTGGVIGDRWQRRAVYGRMGTIGAGFVAAVPFGAVAIFVDSGPVFVAATWLTLFFLTWYHGPLAAVVDDLVAAERAATAQAVFIFTMHLLGTTSSSYVVGVLADRVGLRHALLAPLAAVALAALAIGLGCRALARQPGERRV